ncbi:MAG: rane protein [Chthoniobacteraceae bacterium]|nr:rane protein [Chthoniobacteraceae bacterium]
MKSRTALASLHAAVLLFGLSGLIGKAVGSPALVVTCLRSLVGAAALTVVLALRHEPMPVAWRGYSGRLFAGGILLAAHWWAFFASIQCSTVSLALLTYASYPLFVTLLGWLLLGERPRRMEALACALVIAGLLFVVPDWHFGSQTGIATALGLAAGLTFAMLTLLNRRILSVVPLVPLVTGQTAVAGLVLLPLTAGQLSSIPARDWAWLILLGVVFTGLAHGLFTASLRDVRVAVVGVVAALEPVYGIAAAWIFLGEIPSVLMLCGASLIIGASCLSILPADTRGRRGV